MGIHSAESNILRMERTRNRTADISRLDFAVAEILDACRPRPMLARFLCEAHTGIVASSKIAHIAETHLHAHFRTEKSRVLLIKVHIVVDNRYIGTSQSISMRRSSGVQIVIRRRAVLCQNRERQQKGKRRCQYFNVSAYFHILTHEATASHRIITDNGSV